MHKQNFMLFILTFFGYFAPLSSAEIGWSLPVVLDNTTSTIESAVFSCCNTTTNQVFATWGDTGRSDAPVYSIASYSNGDWQWSNPAVINNSSAVSNNVFLCFASGTNQVFATWCDYGSGGYPTFSIATYAGGTWTWSIPAAITTENSANCNAFVCYNSQTNQVFATWANGDNSHPIYSIASYSGGNWTWSPPAGLADSTSVVTNNLFTSYNSTTNQVFATWGDAVDNNYPKYSIASYVGGSWHWSDPAIIGTPTTEVPWNVFPCFDVNTNQVFATWGDSSNNAYPTYSIASYSGSTWTWSAPAVISTPTGAAQFNVVTSCDSRNNQIFATWSNAERDSDATYSIASYSGGLWSWSEPNLIANVASPVKTSVYNSYNFTTNQTFAIWGNQSTAFPTYSIYTSPIPPPSRTGNGVSSGGSSSSGTGEHSFAVDAKELSGNGSS